MPRGFLVFLRTCPAVNRAALETSSVGLRERWSPLIPPRRPLVGVGDAQQQRLVEGAADELQADGEAGFGEAAGDRQRGLAGEVERERVVEVEAHEGVLLAV